MLQYPKRGMDMRDFPMFTTEYGVASLILKEVPYRQEAYIILQATEQPEELLQECISFCRMVGAEKIYARGHEIVEHYPIHCTIFEMRGSILTDEEKIDHLWPVTKETVSTWREFLNSQLRQIDNAGTLDQKMEKEILEGGAYFVHHAGELLGIGWMKDTELLAVASAQRGMGWKVLNTLLSLVEGAQVELQVASTNEKAIRLYEKMGFFPTKEISRWYRISQA